ncbi:MAG: hypothetical protein EOP51_34005, partial [Sphingobacteriales bacterium]
DNNGNSPTLFPGMLHNVVTLTGNKPNGTAVGTLTDEVNIPLGAVGSYTIDKTSTTASITAINQVVPYVIRITNTGSFAINNVIVADPLLGTLTRSSTDPTGNEDNIFDVGEVWQYTGSYTVTQSDLDNNGNLPIAAPGMLRNTVTLTGNKPDTSPVGPVSDILDIPLNPAPSYTITKASTTTAITAAGQSVPYTITVVNTGATAITNIVVTDPMLGTLTRITDPVGNNNAILNVGETWRFTGSYAVLQSDLDNNGNLPIAAPGVLRNTATLAGTRPNGNPMPNPTSTVNIPLTDNADYTIVKASTTTSVTAIGQVIPYTITINNPSPTAINSVVVADPMLAGLLRTSAGNGDFILNAGETWV